MKVHANWTTKCHNLRLIIHMKCQQDMKRRKKMKRVHYPQIYGARSGSISHLQSSRWLPDKKAAKWSLIKPRFCVKFKTASNKTLRWKSLYRNMFLHLSIFTFHMSKTFFLSPGFVYSHCFALTNQCFFLV